MLLRPGLAAADAEQDLGVRVVVDELAPEERARPVDRRLAAAEDRVPVGVAVEGGRPLRCEAEVGQDVDHVVTRSEPEHLQRDFLGESSRARQSRTDYLHLGLHFVWPPQVALPWRRILEPTVLNAHRHAAARCDRRSVWLTGKITATEGASAPSMTFRVPAAVNYHKPSRARCRSRLRSPTFGAHDCVRPAEALGGPGLAAARLPGVAGRGRARSPHARPPTPAGGRASRKRRSAHQRDARDRSTVDTAAMSTLVTGARPARPAAGQAVTAWSWLAPVEAWPAGAQAWLARASLMNCCGLTGRVPSHRVSYIGLGRIRRLGIVRPCRSLGTLL